jgi:hypothetical protein
LGLLELPGNRLCFNRLRSGRFSPHQVGRSTRAVPNLSGWRRDHQAYFERNGGFDPEMLLVCERFRLVEDFGSRVL